MSNKTGSDLNLALMLDNRGWSEARPGQWVKGNSDYHSLAAAVVSAWKEDLSAKAVVEKELSDTKKSLNQLAAISYFLVLAVAVAGSALLRGIGQ